MTICPELIQKYYSWLNNLHLWALAGTAAMITPRFVSYPTKLEEIMLLLPQFGNISFFLFFKLYQECWINVC